MGFGEFIPESWFWKTFSNKYIFWRTYSTNTSVKILFQRLCSRNYILKILKILVLNISRTDGFQVTFSFGCS